MIHISVGQGGNQVAQQFWSIVDAEFSRKDEIFFRNGKAKSILVDSEPKVLKNALEQSKDLYRPNNIFYEQSGRGNNWAYGYYDSRSSRQLKINTEHQTLLEHAMEALRRESESSDFFEGCVVYHSLGGGTGSGLGSRIVEEIKTEYPHHRLVSAALLPFASGDTPLQSYNSSLSLAWLQEYADAVMLFQNEDLLRGLSKVLAVSKQGTTQVDAKGNYRVGVEDMNKYIAGCLAGVFFPVSADPSSSHLQVKRSSFMMGDLITSVCPLETHKFLEVASAPFIGNQKVNRFHNWKELSSNLCSMASRYSSEEILYSTLSQLIVRGNADNSFAGDFVRYGNKIRKTFPSVPWNPYPLDIRISTAPAFPNMNVTKSLTMVSNRNVCFIDSVLLSAGLKYEAGAYIHWYERYGLERQILEDSFETLRRVRDNYQASCSE